MTSTRSNQRHRNDTVPLHGRSLTRRVPLKLAGAGFTHVGQVRQQNQDTFVVEPELGLYAVLDGMGGARSGDVAARTARDELLACVRAYHGAALGALNVYELLEFAIFSAARAVYQEAKNKAKHQGMGTTAVACLFAAPNQVVIGHAGDSRAYRLRGERLERLTTDHTGAQYLLEAGQITADEAAEHADRHILTRNLGETNGVAPDVRLLDLEPGDRLLLCSDGLNGELPDDVIRTVLGSSGSPSVVARRLVDTVLREGARDNVTAVVIAAGMSEDLYAA